MTVQTTPTEAAHVGERGLGQKCSDRETIPLCAEHHRTGPESHHVLGKGFWEGHALDRDAIVKELNRLYDASSRSNARKAASALIARIPPALSRYVAEQFWTGKL